MPRYACAALLACGALCTPAAADPLCQSIFVTGPLSQSIDPVVLCLPYEGTARCRAFALGDDTGGILVVICLPV